MTNSLYRTANLPVAAYLLANGIRLISCDETRPNHVDFAFEDKSGEVEQLADKLYSRGTVEALAYYKALRDLRVQINATLARGQR